MPAREYVYDFAAGANHPPYRFTVDFYVILRNGQDRSLRFVGAGFHARP